MIDFTKKLKKKTSEKKINPIEIYDSLDRRSVTGPLRPSQESILKEWYEKRSEDNDLIIKLHTGEGKTLIGLLILLSELNSSGEPSLYLCPNLYLKNQVIEEAKKFGIPYCEINESNELPDEFLSVRSILITNVQKLFHAHTKFGLDNKSLKAGALILDDSHACIDSIKDSLSLKVDNTHPLYVAMIDLFAEELSDQGPGSYLEITEGAYGTMLPIPYWAWYEKKTEVTKLILGHKEDRHVTYVWDLIKDKLENCNAYISGTKLEISPYLIPINKFGTFSRANKRILMSATTQDDAFAIKGLGLELNAIKYPLTNKNLKWSGEKMILIPSLIDEELDRDKIIDWLMKPRESLTFGIVSLIPDFRKVPQYENTGALVAKSGNIFSLVQNLKSGSTKVPLVFVNRYDGIDLPDDACRILIIDSKPYFDALSDRYEEDCRTNSQILNIKIAQKIEQGLGRSVRGEKDYSVIIILGGELTKFIKSKTTQSLFSSQTRKQIDIGMQIIEFAQEEIKTEAEAEKPLIAFRKIMEQSLKRNSGWKDFYNEEMEGMEDHTPPEYLYEVLKLEFEAEKFFTFGNEEKAAELMQALADKQTDSIEKGWYLQQLARYKYKLSKSESNEIQKSSFKFNSQLLKPKSGITYKHIAFINESRLQRIKEWVSQYDDYKELSLAVNSLLENFSFRIQAEKFEQTAQHLGEALGFVSQRPDKEFRKGPDNLWCGVGNEYFLIECKSEVEETRAEISKSEAGQMDQHCGWFEEKYGEALCTRILIHPTKKLSYHANFTSKVRIMRRANLMKLKDNIKAFFMEFIKYEIKDLSDTKLQLFIDTHRLDLKSLKEIYSEDPVTFSK